MRPPSVDRQMSLAPLPVWAVSEPSAHTVPGSAGDTATEHAYTRPVSLSAVADSQVSPPTKDTDTPSPIAPVTTCRRSEGSIAAVYTYWSAAALTPTGTQVTPPLLVSWIWPSLPTTRTLSTSQRSTVSPTTPSSATGPATVVT